LAFFWLYTLEAIPIKSTHSNTTICFVLIL
jgi:hypothetical protein